jgi:hypothetical protein
MLPATCSAYRCLVNKPAITNLTAAVAQRLREQTFMLAADRTTRFPSLFVPARHPFYRRAATAPPHAHILHICAISLLLPSPRATLAFGARHMSGIATRRTGRRQQCQPAWRRDSGRRSPLVGGATSLPPRVAYVPSIPPRACCLLHLFLAALAAGRRRCARWRENRCFITAGVNGSGVLSAGSGSIAARGSVLVRRVGS